MRAIFIRKKHFFSFVAVVLVIWLLGFVYLLADSDFFKYFSNEESNQRQIDRFNKIFRDGRENVPGPIAPDIKMQKPSVQKIEIEEEPTPPKVKYGDMGKGVSLPDYLPPELQAKIDEGWKNHSFNQYVSDLIGVRRELPDYRDEWCTIPYRYEIKLPRTSIIICFFNEAWSTLIRSVNSVLDRTPPNLLEEIILVDDFSDMDHLKSPLEEYWESEPKVKIIRNTQREGLIRSRLIGMSHANAEILTFLDSHIEATPGWLEPLLEQIRVNYTTVVSPVIDSINYTTFEYVPLKQHIFVGGFDWNLVFTWHNVPPRENERRTDPAEPVYTPTMAGGLFSISKKFFEEIGTYDPGLEIWGGENLELSFKIWTCGGSLQIVPCSHVGHVFRVSFPYTISNGDSTKSVMEKNLKRVAEVWMDDYKDYYYTRKGNYYKSVEYGDVSSRKKLRKDLHCQSFKWYVNNVYPELFIPDKIYGYGVIGTTDWKFCLDSWGRDGSAFVPLPVQTCYADSLGGSQFWYYTHDKEIRKEEHCMDLNESNEDLVGLYPCDKESSQKWIFDPVSKVFVNQANKKCLDVQNKKLTVTNCRDNSPHQKWFVQHINGTQNSPYSFNIQKLG
ncbi:putative polypeptide N-acetylgalactosaminyltransferase 9 [Diabrotica virgifera virgifera]|uniref:Polypeptide N-acetylgalactosaminyltransferase n=1 Tax=Diabrotica virgifera virgifera TaxID=50390 RepID=A0A6P7FNZ2_DIAVI|nr:putative polypeptide N-acetylgalactosaminyltransferase 9 [Diabrotica virgifera virgifera]